MRAERAVGVMTGAVMIIALPALLAVGVPSLRLGFDIPAGSTVAVTARLMTELFAAALLAQRYRRTASRLDLGLAGALGLMAAADLASVVVGESALPKIAAPQLTYELLGAGLLVAAAVVPRRPLALRSPRRRAVTVAAVIAAVAIVALYARLVVDDHPDVAVVRAATCALLALGSLVLGMRSDSGQDGMARWLSAALVLSALAQLQLLMLPAEAPAVFGWSDVLGLAAAVYLLVAVIDGINADQRRAAEQSVAAERRRMARELHDGLAQEVAFISAQTRHLAEDWQDERARLIATSAQRALDDSRVIIGALTRAPGMPLGASLAEQAREFARRWGVTVELAIEDEIDVAPEKEHAILRIVGEALSNAARHAEASTVRIRVRDRDGQLHVAVRDDGRGFDTEAEAMSGGFGLRSMQERAQLLGAELQLESRPGHGTRVEIALACGS